jgi:hypothetical protein
MWTSTRPDGAHAALTCDVLTVGQRVLTTPTRTMAIGNIATITVGTDIHARPRLLYAILLLIFAAAAFSASQTDAANPVFIIIATVLAVAFAVLLALPDNKTEYLIISCSDGRTTRFTGPDPRLLERARALLTEKIDTGDERMAFTINFAKGVVEELGEAPIQDGYAAPQADPAGQPAAGIHSTAVVNGPSGWTGGSNTDYRASQSPGGAFASEQFANGNRPVPSADPVDFSDYLPSVVEMHRFYARQPDAEHLEQRLSELELLMRSGAQTRGQRGRIEDLSRELSQILQAYPSVAQIFQNIGARVA